MNDFLQSLRNGQADKTRTPKTRKNSDNSYHYTSSPRFHSYGGYQSNRNQGMKRPTSQQHSGNQLPMEESPTISLLIEAIENIEGHFETLAKNQDYLISIQERTAHMIERQAIAIERIVDHLHIVSSKETEPEKDNAQEKKPAQRSHVTFQKPELYVTEPIETTEPVKPQIKDIKPKKPILRKGKKIVVQKPENTVPTENKLLSREAVMDIIHSMRNKGATFDMVASRLVELGQPTFSGRGEWHAQTIHILCNKK